MQRLTIFILGLIFVSYNQASTKRDGIIVSDSTNMLFDSAATKDTLEFISVEPFLFFKSGYILSSTEKNAIIIVCNTDTTYLVKLYSIRNRKWERTDSISGLDAFPSQFELTFNDYNFDKQKDIYIQVSVSNGWPLSRGHLLIVDPVTKKLTRHEETRYLANMKPDPKTETVVSELWNGYNEKGQHQLTIFTNKWVNGKLNTIKKKNITLK